MHKAGGRLFVDITPDLASPVRREIIVDVLGKSEPLIKDALMTIIERGDFIESLPDDQKEQSSGKSNKSPSPADFQTLNFWMKWLSLMVERKPKTLSMLISTNTECDVPEKSILLKLVGVKNQLHLSP
jgi:hypothetical protein